MSACARSVERPSTNPDDEVFCAKQSTREVVVTFNGHRYLVPLCEGHGKEHDDAGARRRLARQQANKDARAAHEERQARLREVAHG